jgi:enolase
MSKKDDTQRKLVENYLQEHRLESILNSVINQCVKDRPQDPFVMMATLLKEHSSAKIGVLSVIGREVLDCRGVPTVEATVVTQQGSFTASVPVGPSDNGGVASVHLKDGDAQRYGGEGVLQAVKNVNDLIAPVLIGMVPQDQSKIDAALVDLDGTGNMAKIGANATLAVSMACARAGAMEKGVSLYRHLADLAEMGDVCLPVPSFGIISGGKQAGNKLAFREFGVMPVGLSSLKDAVRCGAEIYRELITAVREEFGWAAADACGTEGGLCPNVETSEQAIDLIVKAIIAAGYTTEDVKIALGVSADAFVVKKESAIEGEDAAAEAAALEAEALAAEAAEKDGDEDDDGDEDGEGKVADAPIRDYNLQFKSADVDAKEAQIINGDSLREEYRALCEK